MLNNKTIKALRSLPLCLSTADHSSATIALRQDLKKDVNPTQ